MPESRKISKLELLSCNSQRSLLIQAKFIIQFKPPVATAKFHIKSIDKSTAAMAASQSNIISGKISPSILLSLSSIFTASHLFFITPSNLDRM